MASAALRVSGLLLLPPGSLLAGTEPPGKQPLVNLDATETAAPGKFHFRLGAGAAYRPLEGVEFSTGSRSGQERLAFPSTALRGMRSAAGSASGFADRIYNDGYVRRDGGTGNDGTTWYWGYENAAQLQSDSSGNRILKYQGAGDSITRQSGSRRDLDPGVWEEDGDGAVPAIQLDLSWDIQPKLTVGGSMQYSYLGFDGARSLSNFSASQIRSSQATGIEDTYVLGDIIAPSAPYQGSLKGPGPLIPNTPASRSVRPGPELASSRTTFFNRIEESLDIHLHTLNFGPTAATRMGCLELAAGTGLALNIVDWDASHTETLYVRRDGRDAEVYRQWRDYSSGTDVLPGVYVQMAATLPVTRGVSLSAFGNYTWSRSLEAQVGPSRFHLDPSGWMAGGMIGCTF
ncbi:MAG: hypothetical protein JWM59_3393 [Verrucomicrobiales bacterium]|nr:hypothetical protein [Verrucomicrobiales bacterium]